MRSRVAPQPSLALERDKSPLRGAGGLLNLSHSASEAANLPPKRWNLGLGFRAYARVAALLSFFDGFPVLETHALETHLRKCILLIVLGFAKGPSQPIFVGHCFQRHSGSREQIVNGDKLRVKGNPCLVPFYLPSCKLRVKENPCLVPFYPPSSDQVVGAK